MLALHHTSSISFEFRVLVSSFQFKVSNFKMALYELETRNYLVNSKLETGFNP